MRDELLRGIADNPEDAASWLAYADWLQQEDAPRGELIALDIALETAEDTEPLVARRRELLAKRGPALLGETFSRFIADGYGTVRWRRGFIDHLRYDGAGLGHKRAVGWLVNVICNDFSEPFTFMRSLALPATDIASIAPLHRFTQLVELDLDDTNITDVGELVMFDNLKKVSIRHCPIPRAIVDKVVVARPDLKVVYSKPGR